MGYFMPAYSSRRRYTPRPVQNADPAIVQAWKDAHPEQWAWIEAGARRDFEFACSLNAGLHRYGSLTEKQLAAVDNCILKDRQRGQMMRKIEANAPACAVGALETAFRNAKAAGLAYPKLRFADFTFSPAGARSRNPGAIYVKSRHDGEYYGKVMDGRFVRALNTDGETEQAILAVVADPHNAAIAYGKQFGICCCCGRELTDPKSVAKGIGPVCEKNYGWAR